MNASEAISAIVPARNAEEVIAACIESLAAQPQITQIIAVNDQSSDRTLELLRRLADNIPHLMVIDAPPPPAGWVGKNHAAWLAARQATEQWLLFTDADGVLAEGAAAKANGQFLMVRREAYDAAGGHAAVHGEVLEDVALARRVKGAGSRLWFGYGGGIIRVRMYRSF